jgi:hypothetical protein
MGSRADKCLWRAAWLVVIVLASSACSSDEVVQLETVELADGEFYSLAWGGTQVERFHVLARPGLPGENEDGALVLVSPQHAEPCDLGPTQRYYTQQPRSGSKYVLGSPSPARMALFNGIDADGYGTLSFADVDCKRTHLSVPDVRADTFLRLYPPNLEQLLIGVTDRDRSVLLVDPWNDSVVSVARDVANVWATDDGAWFLEKGQLVRRTLDGREWRRVGEDVSAFIQLGGNGDFAYVDKNRLIAEHDGKTVQIATDVCRARSLDSFIPGSLSYFSPCEARRLVITPAVGKTVGFEANVASYIAQRGQLFVAYDSEDGTTTTISTAFAREPDKLKPWVTLPHLAVQDIWPVSRGNWLVLGETDDGTLSLWQLSDSVPSTDPVLLAEGFADLNSTSKGVVFLREPGGELTLRDRDAQKTLFRAEGVTSYNFVFPGPSMALVYLENVDPATRLGRLRLLFLSGEEFVIANDVREYREVWWPERGILYARGGSRAGIRFARVDIPCEMTSDSPWACGF